MPSERSYSFSYKEYPTVDALPDNLRKLATRAIEALDTSYSPYSNYAVGAAVLLDNGEVVQGSNQENAAFPSGLCAERVALFYAGARFPKAAVVAMALVARNADGVVPLPVAPCGDCRQVMSETQKRSGHPMRVVMVGASRVMVVDDGANLLPFAFVNGE